MDYETQCKIEDLVETKYNEKLFYKLIDLILDNCRIDYADDLAIKNDDQIMLFLKTFFSDSYNECYEQLKKEKEEDEEA